MPQSPLHVALLTGGNDKHYSVGLAVALASQGVHLDFIGSNDLQCSEVVQPNLRFLNLRGDQTESVARPVKVRRILKYYGRLMAYAATARPRVFHILWNNKFDVFDRTLLMAYYRLLGKRVMLTAHNVNAARRDRRDGWLNRLSLGIQYRLCDRIFVHTERMKSELVEEFAAPAEKVRVIPYGMNVTIPAKGVSAREARQRLGIGQSDRVVLFFGQIAPYKGLEFLVGAIAELARSGMDVRLVIAGKVKRGWTAYWEQVDAELRTPELERLVTKRIEFIADEDIEPYFHAADVLALPYTNIFQSGVLFLGYSFGLPVIATDVGSLRDDVIEGRTGFVCDPGSIDALAAVVRRYFESDLYRELDVRRDEIRRYAREHHSWDVVGKITRTAYEEVLVPQGRRAVAECVN